MSRIPTENINELDFSVLRSNLVDYVKSKSEFENYDFEASGLNFLVDLLTYNTQYSAYYLNQVASEMFLDTAQKRKNAVSIAKQLGYVANSKTSAKATVAVRLTETTNFNTVITLPGSTKFSGVKATGEVLPFVSKDVAIFNGNNSYTSSIDLIQGTFITENIVVNNLLLEKKYEISSTDIDLDYLNVYVRESSQTTERIRYNRVYDITLLNSGSRIFYVEENFDGKYQLIFGDNVLGRQLNNNNIIDVSYLVTSGVNGNDCLNFTLDDTTLLPTTHLVQTTQVSSQGQAEEDIDTIRNNSRKLFFSQNRSVTEHDYEIMLMKYFPFIESISVWGGEKNTPPLYGSVFCAVKPRNRTFTSASEKQQILDKLQEVNVITILPYVIDPEYTYIKLDIRLVYDAVRINMSDVDIVTEVQQTVSDFTQNNLLKFFSSFQTANIIKTISDLNRYYMGVFVEVKLYQKRDIDVGSGNYYKVNFNNEVERGSLSATKFSYFDSNNLVVNNCYLKESSDYSKIQIVFDKIVSNATQQFTLIENIGTINYSDGTLELEDFSPITISGTSSEMTFEMKTNDYVITPAKEQVLTISINDVNINPVPFVDNSSTSSNIATAELFSGGTDTSSSTSSGTSYS